MDHFSIDNSFIMVGNLLGESPVWNAETKKLYWVDIERGAIHVLSPRNRRLKSYNIGQMVTSAVLRPHGGLVLATEFGFSSWDSASGLKPERIRVLEPGEGVRFNDGKADKMGSFWVGTLGPEGKARLLRLDPDETVHEILNNLTISNGLDWSPDGSWFYHTDSGKNTIYRYAFDAHTREISQGEVFFHPEQGTPDGLTVDSAGCLWVAIWDGGRVVKLSPEGEVLTTVTLPVSHPTSVALGGDDLRTLFITSASTALIDEQAEEQPMAGDLFAIEVETPGLLPNRFAR